MLVLTRKPNETIVIQTPAGPVTVTVLRVRGPQVKLGFDTPPGTPVWREEVLAGAGNAPPSPVK